MHVGSRAMRSAVEAARPLVVLSGHIHEARGIVVYDWDAGRVVARDKEYIECGDPGTTLFFNPGPAKDGFVVINCGNEGQFGRLCSPLGLDSLIDDPRFRTNTDRLAHRTEFETLLKEKLAEHPRDTVISMLEAVNVPCGPINTVREVFDDPHVKARGLEIDLQRPDGAKVPTVAFPARLSATPASYRHAPPALGADTNGVLSAVLGLSDDDITDLRKKGVL